MLEKKRWQDELYAHSNGDYYTSSKVKSLNVWVQFVKVKKLLIFFKGTGNLIRDFLSFLVKDIKINFKLIISGVVLKKFKAIKCSWEFPKNLKIFL